MTSRRHSNVSPPPLLDEREEMFGRPNAKLPASHMRETKPTYRRASSMRSFSTRSTISDSEESEDDDTASSVSLDSILIQMAEEWTSDEETSESDRSLDRSRGRSSSHGTRSATGGCRNRTSGREKSRARKDRKRSSSLEMRSLSHPRRSTGEYRPSAGGDALPGEFLNCRGEFVSKHRERPSSDDDFMNSYRSIEFEDIAHNDLKYMGTSDDFAIPSHLRHPLRKLGGSGGTRERSVSPFSHERDRRRRSSHKKGKRRKKSSKSRRKSSRRRSSEKYHHDEGKTKTSPIQFRSSLMRTNCEDQTKTTTQRDEEHEVNPKGKKSSTKKKNRISLVMREGMELPMTQGQIASHRRTAGSVCSVASNTNDWMLRDMVRRSSDGLSHAGSGDDLVVEDVLAGSSHHTQRSLYSRGGGPANTNKPTHASENAGTRQRRKGLLRAISKRFSKPGEKRASVRKPAAAESEEMPLSPEVALLPPAPAKRTGSGEVSLSSPSNEGHRRRSSSYDFSSNCDYVVPVSGEGKDIISHDLKQNTKALRLSSSDGSSDSRSGVSSSMKPDKRVDLQRGISVCQTMVETADRKELQRVVSRRQPMVETADLRTYTPTEKSGAERKRGQVPYSDRVMSKTLQLGQKNNSISPKRERPRSVQGLLY